MWVDTKKYELKLIIADEKVLIIIMQACDQIDGIELATASRYANQMIIPAFMQNVSIPFVKGDAGTKNFTIVKMAIQRTGEYNIAFLDRTVLFLSTYALRITSGIPASSQEIT